MTEKTGPARKTVALVLGSGGARGYAHIGVIEVLQERGYDIIAISGCSIGAMVGGIYAAGQLQSFKDWATGLYYLDVIRLLDLSLASPGAVRGEKVFSMVNDLIGDTCIEDLPIQFTAVATDLIKQREIWFQEGLLHQAIRASVAIPTFLTPLVMGGQVLVDGGLLNPLPIIPVISARADLIIAVDLNTVDPDTSCSPCHVESASQSVQSGGLWESPSRGGFTRGTKAMPATQDSQDGDPGTPAEVVEGGSFGKLDIINLSFSAMQSTLTEYKLAGYPPDVLIKVPKMACSTFDFHKAPELIKIGRERAEQTLDWLSGIECI